MSHYQFIATEREQYPVRRLCQVLGVPASGFYAWQADQQRAVGQAKSTDCFIDPNTGSVGLTELPKVAIERKGMLMLGGLNGPRF